MSTGSEKNPMVRVAQVLLTFPQCNWGKDKCLEWLKTIKGYECSIVCREDHHETDGEHIHAWMKLSEGIKIRMKRVREMFTWNDRTANIEFVKNTKADKLRTIKYVIKDGDYLVDNCNLDALLGKNKEKKI